jgi:hypothetical protein
MTRRMVAMIFAGIFIPAILFPYLVTYSNETKFVNGKQEDIYRLKDVFRIFLYIYLIVGPLGLFTILFANKPPKDLDKFGENF